MPIFEFKCEECNHTQEELMGRSDPYPSCEKCGGEMGKLISRGGFSLKGGGWAKDLYSSTPKDD